MTTYVVTSANWNDPAFWAAISEAAGGHALDVSGLPSNFNIDIDKASGRIILTDGTTTFTVGEAGYGGASDATLGGSTLLENFERLDFGDGDQLVIGDTSAETITTGSGNDTIHYGDGADTVRAGDGDDLIDDAPGLDSSATGSLVFAEGGNDTAYGTAGDDMLHGGTGDDYLGGDGGADHIFGGDGADTILGGTGNDRISADDVMPTGPNLIVNGSFEDTTGMTTTGYGFQSTTGSVPGWTDSSGSLVDFHNDGRGGLSATEGANWLDMEGNAGQHLAISQTVAGLQPDGIYQLSFDAGDLSNADDGTALDNTLQVYWNGQLVDTIDPPDGGWQTYTYTLTGGAGDGTGTLEFRGAGANDAGGVSLDAVELHATTAAPGGADSVLGGDGDDTLLTGAGEDIVAGGTGNDRIDLGAEDGVTDTLVFSDGDGADTVTGFEGPTDNGDGTFTDRDQLDLSGATDAAGNQLNTHDITVGDDGFGNALLGFPNGDSLTLVGIAPADLSDEDALAAMGVPAPDDIVTGTSGADLIDAGYTDDPEGDAIDAADNATGTNDDSVQAGAGDDTIVSGAGNDKIDGGTGADQIDAGPGDDEILVDQGDTVQGGDGDDTFRLADLDTSGTGNAAIDITGGEGDETNGDTLILTPDVSRNDITFSNTDDAAGGLSGSFTMADGTPVTFSEIENIICFTPGTMILTSHGDRPIETLQPGDLVVTRDQGLRPIRWIGKRTVQGHGRFAPIRVGAAALDPTRKGLLVSPQHRILYTGYRAELLFGESEVLVPATHLVDGREVLRQPCDEVTYIHLMFDHHEVIYAEGYATESFHAGDVGLGAIAEPAREELFALFPELRTAPGHHLETARTCLRKHEAALLIEDAGGAFY
ncbi:Hint domain-containing protein [Roseovarius sp.]|uniref:Hint domain-containing protein n=1 Tax=Roseovarius sp. TaxID=1486281 RepID=UPI003D108C82